MKTGRWFLIFFLVMTLGVFFLFSGQVVQAKPIELSYANLFPPTHLHSRVFEAWGKEIEKRTDDKVKITFYHGQTLLKAAKTYDGVLKGISDIGMSVFGYSRGVFPAMEAIDLPMRYPNGTVATRVINDFYMKFRPKALSKVKVLYLHAHGPGVLHSKKPVYKMEDLKGLKIRSYGFNAKVAEALGGVPVAMPQPGVYEALQKGVVDASLSPYEVLKGWKQAEVIKYTVECYGVGYTAGFYVVMNLDKWNSLPGDVQKVFDEVSAAWIAKQGQAWDDLDKAGKAFTLSRGNKVITLSKEENARWSKTVQPVIGSYIKAAEGKGLPGKDYVNTLRELIDKYSK